MDTQDIVDEKRHARAEATARRRLAAEAAGPDASKRLAANLEAALDLTAHPVVSGFLPIGREIDPLPAMERARAMGCPIALPCVIGRDRPLVFRLWQAGDPLVDEPFGTKAPTQDAHVVTPGVVIVPMLAFDRQGFRLGYGGGFYDRSLDEIRAGHTATAVGVAYSGQEVDVVPRGIYDQPLDLIVTDQEIIRI